ncbi:hypothetical protein F511_42537 [Dorcoceras hygrometricum]|uniref:Uncharacterized protein n=1 Tax=Dorcoceras hygrometricum TaxID=472368 RepID=A0A2Z7CST2_9LAMI|nr:hypothetical protein F511_42537 [Dorcoceras hygrometricum]
MTNPSGSIQCCQKRAAYNAAISTRTGKLTKLPFLGKSWTCEAGLRTRELVAPSWRAQNLFTEPYLLRFPVVDDAALRKVDSVEFFFPRRFFLYIFRRLWWARRVDTKTLLCDVGSYSG